MPVDAAGHKHGGVSPRMCYKEGGEPCGLRMADSQAQPTDLEAHCAFARRCRPSRAPPAALNAAAERADTRCAVRARRGTATPGVHTRLAATLHVPVPACKPALPHVNMSR